MKPLAIFDLDNTLLNGDSDHAWGEFLCQKGIVDQSVYREANDRFFEQYKAGTMDINEFLEFALKPLTEHSKGQLDEWHCEFMSEIIEPIILPKAEALLATHREAGDRLMIITATNSFVTRPIAKRLGVDEFLATEPEQINGAYTGKIAGTPCFQSGKVTRLNEWLTEHNANLAGSHFYSDSINDLPLLEQVERAVAVNPDEHLSAEAQKRGWPILDLRQ